MKDCLNRVLGILLVLSMSAWSQALCPMALLSQSAEPCGTQSKASSPAPREMAQHDCCPRAQRATEAADPVKLSGCISNLRCCSADRQPAHAQKVAQTSPDMAVIARVEASEVNLSSPAQLLVAADASPPTRNTFSFKDDFRI